MHDLREIAAGDVNVGDAQQFLRTVVEPCRPVVIRKTREIVFARGDFRTGERAVFTATSIWKLFPRS